MKSVLVILSTVVALMLVSPYTVRAQVAPDGKCTTGKVDPFYFDLAVFKAVQPPEWAFGLIKIEVGTQTKLSLWTDGKRFELWTATVRLADVEKFVDDLRASCRLPANDAATAALMHVNWEHVDLSPDQFAELHKSFIDALSEYISAAQRRYPQNAYPLYLDATVFDLVFDNGYENIQAEVPDYPDQHQKLRGWIHNLQTLAEAKFHHPVWR